MSVLCIFAIRLELDIFRVGSCILEIGLQDPNFVRLPSQTTLLSFTGAVLSCYRRVFKATSSSDDRKWHVISVSYDCFNGHWRDDFCEDFVCKCMLRSRLIPHLDFSSKNLVFTARTRLKGVRCMCIVCFFIACYFCVSADFVYTVHLFHTSWIWMQCLLISSPMYSDRWLATRSAVRWSALEGFRGHCAGAAFEAARRVVGPFG